MNISVFLYSTAGCAFVTFADRQSASAAVCSLDRSQVMVVSRFNLHVFHSLGLLFNVHVAKNFPDVLEKMHFY